MSGIAGILNFNGKPVEPKLLQDMLDITKHRGPDGTGQWINGSIALGHQMLHTTRESLHEHQPLLSDDFQVCLTMNGRVDNREELQRSFRAAGVYLRDDTDAELVLNAYLTWGESCPERIIGDFAFAIWDGREQKLYCTRDFIGIKPFYYYFDGKKFVFGSEIRQIVDFPGVPAAFNEGMVGEFLADEISSQEETLYANILRLPPAHTLVIKNGALQKSRYWDLDPAEPLIYQSDEAYREQFLEIFKEAIRCRMRSHHPIGAHLSGGLDSSSVVCLAQDLIQKGYVNTSEVETFSLIFPFLPCDESEFVKEVNRKTGCRSNVIEATDPDNMIYQKLSANYKYFPDAPNNLMQNRLRQLAQKKGIRVMLTGKGGDQCLSTDYFYYSDLMRGRKIKTIISTLKKDDASIKDFLLSSLVPFGSTNASRFIKRHLLKRDMHSWLNKEFIRRIKLESRLGTEEKRWNGTPISYHRKGYYSKIFSGLELFINEMNERNETIFSLEERHPFADRRLIEFIWRLPYEQIKRGRYQKFLLRNSLQNLLPGRVLKRVTKAEFTHLFMNLFQTDLFAQTILSQNTCSSGKINRRWLERTYTSILNYNGPGNPTGGYLWVLWQIFCFQLLVKDLNIESQLS